VRIFIDESGTFGRARTGPSISVVGAMILPDYRWKRIQRKWGELRTKLPQLDGEVKGRLLNEPQIGEVVSLLRSNDALFFAAAIDLSHQSEAAVKAHQMGQARGITNTLEPHHHPSLRNQLQGLRSSLEALTPQLYVQSALMFDLIHRALRDATIYFCQRQPKELAGFHWEIDAKDKGITKWEKWWTEVVLPILQSKSESDPWPQLSPPEGNYSFMKRFEVPVPEWARRPPRDREPPTFQQVAWNTRLILMEDFRFTSDVTPGLELVDVLVNAVRRALNGRLQPEGFASISSLMMDRRQSLHLLTLTKANLRRAAAPYDKIILKYFKRGGRSILLP